MKIGRKQAIRLLWGKASAEGMNSDDLHTKLRIMQGRRQIRYDSIRKLSGYEISKILKSLFKVKVFVSDEPIILYVRNICRKHHDLQQHVNNIIKHYKAESIYQLTPGQHRFIVGYLKEKVAEKKQAAEQQAEEKTENTKE
ncbi:MAG: hypothetical protein WC965_11870 [Thiohalomonadaceae bacterium]